MPKRFTDTEKWKDDWYLSLNNDYRIIWQWLLDNCNHAGICKPSINLLNMMCNTSVSEEELIEVMNERVMKINNFWFIPKFIKFQYGNLNSKKPAVVSVLNELKKNNLIQFIDELLYNDCETISESLHNDYGTIKDKSMDKDKDINVLNIKNSNLFRQPQIPTLEEVKLAFSSSGGTKEMAEIFFNKHSATGWFINSSPIMNFRNLIPNFITNFRKNESNKSKTRNQQTNESINYLKQKGSELYNRLKQNEKID